MSVSAIKSAAATDTATTADNVMARIPQKVLGQEDFLQLLVAQLSAQDPLNPKKDTDFIAQMAQFSSLEQTKAMEASLNDLKSQQDLMQASDLIGQEVKLQISKDQTVQGVVSAVNIEAGKPMLVINGNAYDMATLVAVSDAAPQTLTAKP